MPAARPRRAKSSAASRPAPSSASSTSVDPCNGAMPGDAGPASVMSGDGSIRPGSSLGGESSVHVLVPPPPAAAGVASKA
eukprot:scaffold34905_cov64-Phaeocystis_antarctica.AAC.4